MMREVIKRRLTRGLVEQDLPDLFIVDGGKGQLQVACQMMRKMGINAGDVIGLAKSKFQDSVRGPEKVYLPGRKDPLILSKHSAALHLLMKIRMKHTVSRSPSTANCGRKKQTASPLDDIPGIGPKKKKNLLIYFGSIKKIQNVKKEELSQAPSITGKKRGKYLQFLS